MHPSAVHALPPKHIPPPHNHLRLIPLHPPHQPSSQQLSSQRLLLLVQIPFLLLPRLLALRIRRVYGAGRVLASEVQTRHFRI